MSSSSKQMHMMEPAASAGAQGAVRPVPCSFSFHAVAELLLAAPSSGDCLWVRGKPSAAKVLLPQVSRHDLAELIPQTATARTRTYTIHKLQAWHEQSL